MRSKFNKRISRLVDLLNRPDFEIDMCIFIGDEDDKDIYYLDVSYKISNGGSYMFLRHDEMPEILRRFNSLKDDAKYKLAVENFKPIRDELRDAISYL